MAKHSTDENRQYLVDLVAEGEISPFKKDVADLSDAYVDRIVDGASGFRNQEALGLPFDLPAARGHAASEHGRYVERGYEPEIYQRAGALSEFEGV